MQSNQDIFNDRLEELLKNVGFVKLFFMRLIWGFNSKRFLVLILATVFFILGMIEVIPWVTVVGIYTGTEVVRKFMP